jgi:O-acetyl-ADP-ribose deacetylase (regulator of RNase III)
MPFTIIQGDLAAFRADALVNAANSGLQQGGGVCGALFAAAGRKSMQEACDSIAYCAPGQAVVTPAFDLPARYVIHTVGPVYRGGDHGEEDILRAAYTNSLKLAQALKLSSIAFPLISSGIYSYPRDEALRVAKDSIRSFLDSQEDELDVTLVLFNKDDLRINEQLRGEIRRLIAQAEYERADRLSLQLETLRSRRAPPVRSPASPKPSGIRRFQKKRTREKHMPYGIEQDQAFDALPADAAQAPHLQLEELVARVDEGFSATLLRLIDLKGMTDVAAYKRANLDRKHFSKIRSNPAYAPSKQTALALAIALELDREETQSLLAKAGYALSPAQTGDIIVGYFIDHRIFDIDEINAALFEFDQQLLGGGRLHQGG